MNKEIHLLISYLKGIHLDCSSSKTPPLLSNSTLRFMTPSILNLLVNRIIGEAQTDFQRQYDVLELKLIIKKSSEKYVSQRTIELANLIYFNMVKVIVSNKINIGDNKKFSAPIFGKYWKKMNQEVLKKVPEIKEKE